MGPPRILRALVPDGQHVVVVDADEVEPEKVGQYSDLLMRMLNLGRAQGQQVGGPWNAQATAAGTFSSLRRPAQGRRPVPLTPCPSA